MLEVILTGVVFGIAISVLLLLFVMFVVHKFNFKDYVPTLVYVVVAKETPLWYMVAGVVTTSVLVALANWGIDEGGVAKLAVMWGGLMYVGTFVLYRVLWAISVAGMNVKKWNGVWALTRTRGNVHRAADQKISFVILVVSAILTTWLALQGVYG